MRTYSPRENATYSDQPALYSRILEAALNAKNSAIGELERGINSIKNAARKGLDRVREDIELMDLLMNGEPAYATNGRYRPRRKEPQYGEPIGWVHYATGKKKAKKKSKEKSEKSPAEIEYAKIIKQIKAGKRYSGDRLRILKKRLRR